MNFHELYRKIEAIDKGQSLDEFNLNPFKKKELPAAPTNKPPVGTKPSVPAGQDAQSEPGHVDPSIGGAINAIKKRQQMLKDLEEESKEEVDYGSRMKTAFPKDEEKEKEVDEAFIDECGMDMPGGMMGMRSPMEAPKQADSVTMNVSMNGSGQGGIRDLLNVLKDIQDSPSDDMPDDDMGMDIDMEPDEPEGPDDTMMKKKLDAMGGMLDDEFANSVVGDPGPEMGGVDMVTHDGNDIHSSAGKVAHTTDPAYTPLGRGETMKLKVADGDTIKIPSGNLKLKLESLYKEILNRDLTESSVPRKQSPKKNKTK